MKTKWDGETTEAKIVKYESTLRIIITLSALALNESEIGRKVILAEISKQATEAMK